MYLKPHKFQSHRKSLKWEEEGKKVESGVTIRKTSFISCFQCGEDSSKSHLRQGWRRKDAERGEREG